MLEREALERAPNAAVAFLSRSGRNDVARATAEMQGRMRQMQGAAARTDEPQAFRGEVYEGEIIEGEVIEVVTIRVQESEVRR